MFLSLETEANLDYVKQKLIADLDNPHLRFSPIATKKLKEILVQDQISSPEEFLKEVEKVLISTNTFTWKIQVFLLDLSTKLSDQIHSISFVQACLSILALFFSFFYYRKFNKKAKLTKKLSMVLKPLIIRFAAMIGYYPSLIALYVCYVPQLIIPYPRIIWFTPVFIQKSMGIYSEIPFIEYFYFFLVVWVVLTIKWPRERFIRFHFVKGVLFFTLQQIPLVLFDFFRSDRLTDSLNIDEFNVISLFSFILNMYALLPGIWEALTLRYPKAYRLRESIELILGRDRTDGFKWWDRKK